METEKLLSYYKSLISLLLVSVEDTKKEISLLEKSDTPSEEKLIRQSTLDKLLNRYLNDISNLKKSKNYISKLLEN